MSTRRPDFITVWKVPKGNLANRKISFSIAVRGDNQVAIDWGDGVIEKASSGFQYHFYQKGGTYDVRISHSPLTQFSVDCTGTAHKLIDLKQWGIGKWDTLARMFYNAKNMTISATDAPNLDHVGDANHAFYGCAKLNNPVQHWRTKNIVNMSAMFAKCTLFNQPLGRWDTSSVRCMDNLFDGCTDFNQPLANWNMKKVMSVYCMLLNTPAFHQDISSFHTPEKAFNMGFLFGSELGFYDYIEQREERQANIDKGLIADFLR